eukprot:SAG22_NODE_970_length_6231_cov_2.345890_2_plen_571_part_00
MINTGTLVKAVKESKVCVLLLTKELLTRSWCLLEIFTALDNKVPIVPVLIVNQKDTYSYEAAAEYLNDLENKVTDSEFMQDTFKVNAWGEDAWDGIESNVHTSTGVPLTLRAVQELLNAKLPSLKAEELKPCANPAIIDTQVDVIAKRVEDLLQHVASGLALETNGDMDPEPVRKLPGRAWSDLWNTPVVGAINESTAKVPLAQFTSESKATLIERIGVLHEENKALGATNLRPKDRQKMSTATLSRSSVHSHLSGLLRHHDQQQPVQPARRHFNPTATIRSADHCNLLELSNWAASASAASGAQSAAQSSSTTYSDRTRDDKATSRRRAPPRPSGVHREQRDPHHHHGVGQQAASAAARGPGAWRAGAVQDALLLRQQNQALQTRLAGIESLLEDTVCPLSLCAFEDPVVAGDGHTYDRHSIEQWMLRSNKSPLTNTRMPAWELRTNYLVKSLLEEVQNIATEPAEIEVVAAAPVSMAAGTEALESQLDPAEIGSKMVELSQMGICNLLGRGCAQGRGRRSLSCDRDSSRDTRCPGRSGSLLPGHSQAGARSLGHSGGGRMGTGRHCPV